MDSKVLDFLAIDRFTGGAKARAKFDALASWQPIFRLRMHLENPAPWELGWLALVLRDLEDGLLTIGFGGAKGFGRMRLHAFQVHLGYLTAADWHTLTDQPLSSTAVPDGLYKRVTQDSTQWLHVATAWVQAFHTRRTAFVRPQGFRLQQDTYFEGNLPTLYDKEAYRCLHTP
jgi:hypothetical protein